MPNIKKNRKKNNPANNEEKKRKQTPSWLVDFRYGRSLSVDFFRKNAWFFMVFVVAMLSLIGLRYKNKTKMMEIKKLNIELKQASGKGRIYVADPGIRDEKACRGQGARTSVSGAAPL